MQMQIQIQKNGIQLKAHANATKPYNTQQESHGVEAAMPALSGVIANQGSIEWALGPLAIEHLAIEHLAFEHLSI